MITVFTPTYNRKNSLKLLYNTLKMQTNQNFLWHIIDDGSSDGTEEMVKQICSENIVNIKYERQKNHGKYYTLLEAIKKCTTETFVCIDSDDYVTKEFIECLNKKWNEFKYDLEVIGIVSPRYYSTGEMSCRNFPKDNTKTNFCQLSNLYCIKGETVILLRTKYIQQFQYPEFPNEKFVSEEVIYNLYDKDYSVITMSDKLCIMEYLEDGLTYNLIKNWATSPKATVYMFKNRYETVYKLPLKCKILKKIKTVIFQNCFAFYTKQKIGDVSSNKILSIITMPVTLLIYMRRFKNESKI